MPWQIGWQPAQIARPDLYIVPLMDPIASFVMAPFKPAEVCNHDHVWNFGNFV